MTLKDQDRVTFEQDNNVLENHQQKKYKVLLISQNSADIFMLNNLLNELGNFKVYEAGNLSTAFKVVGYHILDMIIIDDKLPTVTGYDIIKRLNKSQILKDVPKVMLLTQNYKKSSYDNHSLTNIDFIKKPIDGMIFKTRVTSILKATEDNFLGGSLFENMIDKKINEAKEFLKIYKSFLDIDENILFVYDHEKNKVLETNRNFNKFFGQSNLFNRVINSDLLMKNFIPKLEDTNYLNSHHFSTWLDFIMSVNDFNFLIKVKRGSDYFSFNVMVNKIKIFDRELYIIKLSNHNIYTSRSDQQIKNQNKKISIYLESIKSRLDNLEQIEDKEAIANSLISVLDELDLDATIFKNISGIENQTTNVHFVIASILKQKLDFVDATLNSKKVDIDFMEDSEILYADVSADAINDLVKGIIECYHESEHLRVDIKLFKLEDKLKIEIITVDVSDSVNKTLIERVFDFNLKEDNEKNIDHLRPKNIYNAVDTLKADIKTYFNNDQNIFMISIPLI